MDVSDAVTSVLEDGERIVWSDAPAGALALLWRNERRRLICATVMSACALFNFGVGPSAGPRLGGGFFLMAVGFAFVSLWNTADGLRVVWAVTDRGRCIEVRKGVVSMFLLSASSAITCR